MGHLGEWDWLGTLALALFWALIILLALAPTKYLRSELDSAELRGAPGERATPDIKHGNISSGE